MLSKVNEKHDYDDDDNSNIHCRKTKINFTSLVVHFS